MKNLNKAIYTVLVITMFTNESTADEYVDINGNSVGELVQVVNHSHSIFSYEGFFYSTVNNNVYAYADSSCSIPIYPVVSLPVTYRNGDTVLSTDDKGNRLQVTKNSPIGEYDAWSRIDTNYDGEWVCKHTWSGGFVELKVTTHTLPVAYKVQPDSAYNAWYIPKPSIFRKQ